MFMKSRLTFKILQLHSSYLKLLDCHLYTWIKHPHKLNTISYFISQRCLKSQSDSININPDLVLTKSGNLTLSSRLVALSPERLKPYLYLMRMDRPIGSWLVFLPAAWSITMATKAGTLPDLYLLCLFGLGSVMMRGAGCIINDVWDQDFDKMVERTKSRPLASGQVTRLQAIVFMSVPLSISLSILLTFNWNTIILGVMSVIPCIIYPLMKRVTYWPQLVLGLTFNWGVILGWSVVQGSPGVPVLPLYISAVSWTLVFDTIYAFQDIEDDLKIGLKSTAIRFGSNTKYWLTGFTALTGTSLCVAGYLAQMTWPYYFGTLLFTSHLLYQTISIDLTDRMACGNMFRSNRDVGLVFWILIVMATLIKKEKEEVMATLIKKEQDENRSEIGAVHK